MADLLTSGSLTRTQGSRGSLTVSAQSIYETSTTQLYPLGTRLCLGERTFRYAFSGEAATAGLVQSAANALVTEDTVTIAHGKGTYKVTVTAAGVAVDDYADGWLVVDEGAGAGESYHIRSNTATASGVIVCTLYDPLTTAWSTSTTDVTITKSIYRDFVVNPVAGTSLPIGVPLIAFADNEYGWLQTWGPCGVKIDAASGGGAALDEKELGQSTNHVGQLEGNDTPVSTPIFHIARVILAGTDYTDDKIEPVFLILSP